MSTPQRVMSVLLTLGVGLAWASTADVSASAAPGSGKNSSPATGVVEVEDPNLAPYPKRDIVLQMKGGASSVTDKPVPLDITGEGDRPERLDKVQAALKATPDLDGGLRWDWRRNVLVVPLVGPLDGSSAAIEKAKDSVAAAAEGLVVEFQSVAYSRGELEELADRIFTRTDQWAPGLTGASGGWDPEANRVLVSVRNDSAQREAWADRVKGLNDKRVVFREDPPKPGAGPQGRMSDFRPWSAGSWLSGRA